MLEAHPNYFVGNSDDQTFRDTHGWLIGFFMQGKVFSDGRSLDILARKDFECAIMNLPEVDPAPPHYHVRGYELTFCLSGRLHLVVNQKYPVELVKNQFLIIPPGVILQNPKNDPETKVFVVKAPSIPNDKFYAESRD